MVYSRNRKQDRVTERVVGVEVSKKGHSKVTFRLLGLIRISSDRKSLVFESGLVCKHSV